MSLPLLLAAAALLVFLNSINHPFVHDDIIFILHNAQIGTLQHLSDLFFKPEHNQILAGGLNSYYRPLLEVFYRLEYHIFGFNPAMFHCVNLLVHMANGLLLFGLLKALRFTERFSFAISLLFLIHPVQTEAVACVSGFSNLACSLFLLLTVRSYLKQRFVLSFIYFVIALFVKETAIILLPLIILIDWYRNNKAHRLMWGVYAVLTCFFLLLRQVATGSNLIGDIFNSPGELWLRLLAIPNTIVMYLCLLIMPVDLHYYRNTDILADSRIGFFILGVIVAILAWLFKKRPQIHKDLIFGLAWFFICLFPVLNMVPLINEYSFILTAEHFLYLPMVGFVIVLAVILKQLLNGRLLAMCAVGVSIIFMGLSVYQNNFWRNQVSLFERMVHFEPRFGRGHILLAKEYYSNHRYKESLDHYNQALEIMNSYERKASNIKAKNFYQGYIHEIYADMASALIQDKRYEEALRVLNKALVQDPKNVGLLNSMALCYLALGDKPQAETILKLVLGLNPAFLPAKNNLNRLLQSN